MFTFSCGRSATLYAGADGWLMGENEYELSKHRLDAAQSTPPFIYFLQSSHILISTILSSLSTMLKCFKSLNLLICTNP